MDDRLDRLHDAYVAYNAGEFDNAIEALRIADDFEYLPPRNQPTLHGPEGFRAWMEPDVLLDQRIEPLEFKVSGDKVLVLSHTEARGKTSGIELTMDLWTLWTMPPDGPTTRLEVFMADEREAAHAAAGLEP